MAQDDNVRQNSSQVLIGTLEQNAQVPAEDQITSLPVGVFIKTKMFIL